MLRATPLVATLALSACATPGNFTSYDVPCAIGDDGVRKNMHGVAQNVSDALHKPIRTVVDSREQLFLAIDLSSEFWNGGTSIGFRWVNEGNVSYEITIDQRETQRETGQIETARGLIEKAVAQSACPAFRRKIDYSQPLKYT